MLASISSVSSGMVDVGLLVWTLAGLNGGSSLLTVPTPVSGNGSGTGSILLSARNLEDG
jgi:hypothetical protein